MEEKQQVNYIGQDHFPEIIMKIVDKVKETYKKFTDFDGFPLVNAFKRLVNRITTFISDIQSDVLEFYHVSVCVSTNVYP
jgi:ferritin-like protein